MSNAEFDVFLSHNSDDKPFVRLVAARLQREGVRFFLDESSLVPGTMFQQPLEQALASSRSCAVFIGPEGWGAWHKLEMRAAVSRLLDSNGTFRVIPVQLPGVSRPAEAELPAFLRQVTWVEFQDQPERDEANYQRLKAGIEGRAPGFVPASTTALSNDVSDARIVPPGLRSFDQADHRTFMKLVPGPRDAAGLPRVVAHWKRLIDQIDSDRTFKVAYWWGPSGCGKSSLVRAGLIPVLNEYVVSIAIDATAEGTESRLLGELRKVAGPLSHSLDLQASLAWIIQNPGALGGRKLLLVIDQFEQWLHATRGQTEGPLASALRLCDGRNLQALLLVRDEFTVPVHRFMKLLGVEVREGFNYELIDLLDADFATQVLFEYGRAYRGDRGDWPDKRELLDADQQKFLQLAVKNLQNDDGKIVSVQLALFAQMLANQPWKAQTLADVGGAAGVGHRFLKEKFDERTASAEAQMHKAAAIRILESLLPELGSTIKGRMRSRAELIEVAEYAQRADDFSDLLKLLDGTLRIITPVADDTGQSYQLAHDYLVPSLRDWLTAKKKGDRRGRAELRLAEQAALWKEKPENRHLPTLWEYLSVLWFVPQKNQTELQQKMLKKAGRLHALQGAGTLAGLLVVGFGIWWILVDVRKREVSSAVAALQKSTGPVVGFALKQLHKLRSDGRVLTEIKSQYKAPDVHGKLPLAYALADFGEVDLKNDLKYLEYLCQQIEVADSHEVDNIAEALGKSKNKSLEVLKLVATAAVNAAGDEKKWRLKTRFAVVALHLEHDDIARDMCQTKDRPDPNQRTMFIDSFPAWHGNVARLAKFCKKRPDSALTSGIVLGIGGVSTDSIPLTERSETTEVLRELYNAAPETSTHSSAAWALRRWGVELPELPATNKPVEGRSWFVNNSAGLTMLKIPGGSFVRKDPDKENAKEQTVTLTQDFFLSDREISVGQFQKFMDDDDRECPIEKPKDFKPADPQVGNMPDQPVQNVSWNGAVQYCNWLSCKEGRKACYEQGNGSANWQWVPTGNGYRLPTEAEWEYACRASTKTDYCNGADEVSLQNYATFFPWASGKTTICGRKLPNAWGLFDMHGNVWEWCDDWWEEDYKPEAVDPRGPSEGSYRVHRGGSWVCEASICRSGYRIRDSPDYRNDYLGFRVALSPSGQPPEAELNGQASGAGSAGPE